MSAELIAIPMAEYEALKLAVAHERDARQSQDSILNMLRIAILKVGGEIRVTPQDMIMVGPPRGALEMHHELQGDVVIKWKEPN